MRRILMPGGRLTVCETGRTPDEGAGHWQGGLTPHEKCPRLSP